MRESTLQELIEDMESRIGNMEPMEHTEIQAAGKYLFNRLYDYDYFFRYIMGKFMALVVTVARLSPDLLSKLDDDLHIYGSSVFAAIGASNMIKKEEQSNGTCNEEH